MAKSSCPLGIIITDDRDHRYIQAFAELPLPLDKKLYLTYGNASSDLCSLGGTSKLRGEARSHPHINNDMIADF
jgi:hypothetical protein